MPTGSVSRVAGTVVAMQPDASQGRDAVEDLEDLTAAVARLEATAEALDARLGAASPGVGRA